jgi:hypothetical protein
MLKKLYILLFPLFWIGSVLAQEKFTASVSKTTVGTGEQFEVSFSTDANGDRFTPPSFSGFQVLSGPNESTSMTSINGNTSMNTSVSYILMAVKEGDLTIGAASIIVNGRRLTTNPIRLKVVKGQPVQQNNAAQGQAEQAITPPTGSDLSKLLFIKAEVSKTNVYQGEQITLRYRIYSRVDILQNQLDKVPDLTGFWNEDIKGPQQIQMHPETYKGATYEVADLKKSILFGEHSGNITLDPFIMTFVVRQPVQSRDIIDQFFGSYKEVKYQAKSAPVIIHVKPLPEAGKPAGFTGAVGTFKLSAGVDKTTVKANDAINYKVKVTGAGNIKLLKNLSAEFPEDFEKYDPKITDSVTEDENGVQGTRTYNYLLIPRHKGDFTIAPLKFAYFNPATNRYVSLAAKGFDIKVLQGDNQANVTAFTTADKQDVKLLDKDIRYIKTNTTDLVKPGDMFYGSFWYYLLLLIGPLLCVGAYNYRNWLIKNNSDIVKVKNRRAGKVAAKHLASAQKQLSAKNSDGFYEDLFTGLYGYLSDKLNIPYADLNRETIASSLKKHSVGDPLVNKLLETLELCEMARYAPVTHIAAEQVFEKAKTIINDLENEIK